MTFAARALSVGVAVLVTTVGCDSVFRFDQPLDTTTDGGSADDADKDDAGTRLPCTDDTVCGGLRCQVSTGMCVACLTDPDCSGALGRCDTARGLCVECNAITDCPQRHGCDPVTKRCLDLCYEGDELCTATGFRCDENHKLCIECSAEVKNDCLGSPSGAVCDKAIGRCVECDENANCPTAKPVCDRRSGRCVGCVTSAECGVGSVCDSTALTCRQLP